VIDDVVARSWAGPWMLETTSFSSRYGARTVYITKLRSVRGFFISRGLESRSRLSAGATHMAASLSVWSLLLAAVALCVPLVLVFICLLLAASVAFVVLVLIIPILRVVFHPLGGMCVNRSDCSGSKE
jgi:hypothetical protein